MKKITLCLISIFTSCIISAQVIPAKNTFQSDMAKVIADYPNQFKNLSGELLVKNPQSTEYKTKQNIKEAEECTITKYSSTGKEIFSWQALMLRTDDFELAKKKFKTLYNALNNLLVNINTEKIVFKGDYNKPTEDKKFTSIVFSPAGKEGLKIRVELLLQAEMLEWSLKVLVYEKEKEDDESGQIKE